jgi:hypothetical protein
MREYILTDNEKQIINKYLETGEKVRNFDTLLHRIRNMQGITTDMELIKKFLEKVEGKLV